MKGPVSPRVILTLLYAMLALLSTFIGGSKAFMLMGALCADLMALLVANIVFHATPERRGEEGIALTNAVFMLCGGFFIMLVFYMAASVFTSNLEGSGAKTEALVAIFWDNALPMLLVLASAGVAYWLDLKAKSENRSSQHVAYHAVRYRMKFMLVWLIIFCVGLGVGHGFGRMGAAVFVLFLLRSLMEWLLRGPWKDKRFNLGDE